MKLHMQETKQLTFEEGCNRYLQNCKERNLRGSIVAKLADDIIVGVRGNHVEIVVKKSF